VSESVERFSRLEASFHRLRRADRTLRESELGRLRAEDPSLAEELASMLAAHELERPLVEATVLVEAMRELAHGGESAGGDGDSSGAASDDASRSDDRSTGRAGGLVGRFGILRFGRAAGQQGLPRTIGDYRILRVIGEGGMGVVYEAEQRSPKRRVALKIVRGDLLLGPSREERLHRFEREVEALGRLEHPNIARVHDAGEAFVDGDRARPPVPFVAMEFVDGAPLLAYARAKRLDVRASIELMAQLCDGVAAAHAAGVVHRDLKPANILVTAAGIPKVLDFGIARFVGEEQATRTLGTGEGELLGTIPYMSPEQIAGHSTAISAATDVYALGVTLYELLVGRLPLEVRSVPLAEAARIIREERPTRLGEVETSLRGDLETIVAKLLEKEPSRRYRSAGEVADDLRRWLRHEPIRARPASAIYRARTFVRRHRTLVASTLAIIVLLVASSAALAVVLLKERDQRARAEAANEQLAREAYHATLAAARASISAGEFVFAARELAAAQPERRGFEWRLLERMLAPVERSYRVLDGPIVTIAIPDTGPRLIALDELGQGVVIDRTNGSILWRFETAPGSTKQIVTDRTGHRFVARTVGSVVAFEVGKGELFRAPQDMTLTDAAISRDGETLLATDLGGGRLHTIAMRDGSPIGPPRDDRIYLHASFDEADRIIVADRSRAETGPLDEDGSWRIPGSFRGMATSRGLGMLVRDEELRVVDVERGAVLAALHGPFGRDVGFALDRRGALMSISRPGDVTEIIRTAAVADRPREEWPRVTTHPVGRVWGRAAGFDPEEDLLWTGAGDGTVRAWRPDESAVWSLRMPRSFVGRFDAEGRRLAAAHWGTLMVLDAATGDVERVALLHRPEILAVAWDRFGERIATADERGGVRVVDRATGAVLAAFQCDRTRLTQIGWTHDDRIVVTDGRRVGAASVYESPPIPRAAQVPLGDGDPSRPPAIVPLARIEDSPIIGPIVASPDGRGTAFGARGGAVLWRDASGASVLCVQPAATEHVDPPTGDAREAIDWLLFDVERGRLLAGAGRSLVHWPLAAMAGPSSVGGAEPIVGTATEATLLRSRVGRLSPDGARIAIADRSGSVQLFDADRLELVLGIEVPAFDADDAAWRGAEAVVLTGSTTLLATLETADAMGRSERRARLRRGASIEWVESMFAEDRLVERVVERIGRAAGEGTLPEGVGFDEAIRYATLRGSDPNLLNSEAWKLARHAEGRLGEPTETDRVRAAQAVELARAADRAIPNDHAILNTLALALVRARQLDDALRVLDACDALAEVRDPFDVAFRAMVHAVRGDRGGAERLLAEIDTLVGGRVPTELTSIIDEVRERIAPLDA
jgi:sugar lactone lactonase YvrE/predicted Ser/Thr protein kinase